MAWRLSIWKTWAGVVGTHTWILCSAHNCMKRSSGRRVLRALALIAVRQQHGQAAESLPLVLAAGDELVDDNLGAIGEIAKLASHTTRPGGGVVE